MSYSFDANKKGFKTVKGKTGKHTEISEMTLSDQALGAVMMALQQSLLNQTDIVPVLKSLRFANTENNGLVVVNPPVIKTNDNTGNTDAKI